MKRCTVSFALPQRQWLWEVDLEDAATVGDALAAARRLATGLEIPWESEVGIFGALCDRNAVPRNGDRIEIYRPLKADPKESRRARATAGKAARDRDAARPRASSSPKTGKP